MKPITTERLTVAVLIKAVDDATTKQAKAFFELTEAISKEKKENAARRHYVKASRRVRAARDKYQKAAEACEKAEDALATKQGSK